MRRGTDKFKPAVPFGASGLRECDHPHCHSVAEHRAPKSRDRLEDYFWFCLEHVREYNKSWNFCDGMDENQIESEIREDTVWRRPTWPMGSAENEKRWRFVREGDYADSFGSFSGDFDAKSETYSSNRQRPDSPEARAFRILGLDPTASLSELKTKYKELVKTHHPDRNGGDKVAEERLKDINDAYSTLRKTVTA
jgi:curved DNA-binding protein CbpA